MRVICNAMRFLTALFVLVALGMPSLAQEQDVDPSQRDGERLPSLTPQEFDVHSTVEIRLPDIERQPLSGFGPPPRRYVVPAERQAFTRPYDPDADALPPHQPTDPGGLIGLDISAVPNRVEGGLGNGFVRYGRVDFTRTGQAGLFFADVDYDGMNRNEERTGYGRIAARGGGRTFGKIRFGLTGGYLRQVTRMTDGSDASISSVDARGEIRGFGPIPFEATLEYRHADADREFLGTTSGADATSNILTTNARASFVDERIHLSADGGILSRGATLPGATFGNAGVSGVLGRPGGARLEIGVGILGYRSQETGNTPSASASGIGPIVDLDFPLGTNLSIIAKNRPTIEARDVGSLFLENPFTDPTTLILPDVTPVDAIAGIKTRFEMAQLRAYATGMYSPAYTIFQKTGNAFTTGVESVESFGVGGDVTISLPTGFSASARLLGRTSNLRNADGDIPYFAGLVAEAGVQIPFAGNRGRIGLSALFETQRPGDRFGTENAPNIADLSAHARFDLTDNISLTLRGEQLLGPVERWPGYTYGTGVMGGLRFSW